MPDAAQQSRPSSWPGAPNLKSRRISGLQLAGKHLGPVAKCPPRYSEEDWDYNNKIKFRITCDQEKLAERIVE